MARLVESRSAFARRQGVSPAAVTQWAQAGRIRITADGRVDVDKSIAMLAEAGPAARGGKRTAGTAGGVQDGAGSPRTTGTLLDARTAVAEIQAERARIEHRARIGELIERTRYAKALEDALAPILAELDSLSALIGPDLAAETDVRKVQNMLDDAIAKARRNMAATLQQMIAGPDAVRQ